MIKSVFSERSPTIVAEIGINHGGSVETAMKLIKAAKLSGVDAVKFQTFDTSEFLSTKSDYYEIFKSHEFSQSALLEIVEFAKSQRIGIFSACFDPKSASFWNDIGAPIFKVASGDLTHLPLLEQIASYGKPIILSTGASSFSDIQETVDFLKDINYQSDIVLLHCVSKYPTATDEANIPRMLRLASEFDVAVGFSDHTEGLGACVAAVAMGAVVIEKHFTLDKSMAGPDHALSATPDEMELLVRLCREASDAMISCEKEVPEGFETQRAIRRSLVARRNIAQGEVFNEDMISIKRPGGGLAPINVKTVLGKVAARDIKANSLLENSDVESR